MPLILLLLYLLEKYKMLAGELIEKLQQVNDDAEVFIMLEKWYNFREPVVSIDDEDDSVIIL